METKKQKTGDQGTDDPRISITLLFFYLDRYLLILLFLIYDTRAFGLTSKANLPKAAKMKANNKANNIR